jgi:hypothetical protein
MIKKTLLICGVILLVSYIIVLNLNIHDMKDTQRRHIHSLKQYAEICNIYRDIIYGGGEDEKDER